MRSYSEVIRIEDYADRLRYLRLDGVVAHETFGKDRWLNQKFYKSSEWLSIRNYIVERDKGCDLAVPGYELGRSPFIIHHIDPITVDDLLLRSDRLLNPDNLILVSLATHNIIHYGNVTSPNLPYAEERRPGDTRLW